MNVTEADVRAVLDAHPALTAEGYGQSNLSRRKTREEREADRLRNRAALTGPHALSRIQASVDFLSTLQPRRTATEGPSSYGLKHVMEHAGGPYVTNGEFIAAALLLGLPIEFCGLNPLIGVTRRSVDAVRKR